MTSEDIDEQVRRLADPNENVRRTAAEALGHEASGVAVEALAGVLLRGANEDEFVRREAVISLGEIGGEDAWRHLETTLRDERQGDVVREEAAIAMGRASEGSARSKLAAFGRSVTGKEARWANRALRGLR